MSSFLRDAFDDFFYARRKYRVYFRVPTCAYARVRVPCGDGGSEGSRKPDSEAERRLMARVKTVGDLGCVGVFSRSSGL